MSYPLLIIYKIILLSFFPVAQLTDILPLSALMEKAILSAQNVMQKLKGLLRSHR